jgi:alpha-ketoglutarate-dependent taurine dioxygenase
MRLLAASGSAELAQDAVADHLARDGLVMIRRGSVSEIRALLTDWAEPYAHPHDHEPGLTAITPYPRVDTTTGDAGFTRARLLPHTDRSLHPEPPSVLAAVMVSPAASGGHTLLADGAEVLRTLRRVRPLAAVSRLRLRTASGDLVPIFVVREGLARIRFRDDPLATPWMDGDRGVVAALRESISAATRSLPLSAGDGYVLHNHRYLHGRSSFTGHRYLVRILASVTCARLSWLNQGFRVADA